MELVHQFMKKLKTLLQFNKLLIIFLLIVCIYLIINIYFINYKSVFKGSETKVIGKIINYSFDGDLLKLELKINPKEKIMTNYIIKSEQEKKLLLKRVSLGAKIKLTGKMLGNYNNTIPNNFNYKKYLEHNKIYYSFKVDDYTIYKNKNFFYKIKDKILKRAYKLENNEYYLAFLLGNKNIISKEEYKSYQINGIAHLLAISGMHLGIIIHLCDNLLHKFKYRNLIIFLILLFVCFLVGFTPSVLRVTIFFLLKFINNIKNINYSNIDLLLWTIGIEIIINPFVIYSVAFIYSHVITFGIFYFHLQNKGKYLKNLLKLSLISFLFSIPITARLNYEINLFSIISNLIFVPLVSFIIYPYTIISFIIPNKLYNILILFFKKFNFYFTNFKLVINVPKLSIILIIIYYVILLLSKKNIKMLFILPIIILINKVIYKIDNNYYMYFFDVGEGDCGVIISPYKKKTVMIDTGGKLNFRNKEWQKRKHDYYPSDGVMKFLKSIGIIKVDYLITSHGDYDHLGDAINIVKNFKVGNVIFNIGDYNKLELDLIKVLEEKRIPYYQNIKSLNIGNNKLYFLNTRNYYNENDNSSVIYTKINNKKILLMGDASKVKELDIIDKYNIKDIDILKVGHHGSDTSSSREFINTIKPKTCIISVGKNNRFHHPRESVIDTLDDYCDIYRTDIDGSIDIEINKNKIRIS